MFRKTRLNLAVFCAGITVLILSVMSCCFLYVSEKSLKDSSFHTFQNRMEHLSKGLVKQTLITSEWLYDTAEGGNYLIHLKDNGVPLLLNRQGIPETAPLFEAAGNYYKEHFSVESLEAEDTFHQEFSFSSKEKGSADYYACVITSNRPSGTLQAIILMPLRELSRQIRAQRIWFLLLVALAAAALFFFSWYFTGRLLLPLEENRKRQAQFVASASHELRTPLAVILSCASAAGRADQRERTHFLSSIRSEGLRMSRLVDDMLLLSSADAHVWTIQKVPLELDTLLLETCEAFESLATEKNIRLTAELPETLFPPCLCDRERIRQVLSILLHNAVSYTPSQGVIRISLSRTGKFFAITVADNGPGIPDEQKKHVFERFYRADASRSRKGHFGLGLCIASEIISAHHGQIRLEDTPGGGSTFRVLLPEE